MRRSNFALRLQPSLLEELRKAADLEGVALNQLINVAVAEKVSALRTEKYFRERGRRANRAETLRILERAGKGNAPVEGDELPAEWQKKPGRGAVNGRDSVSKRGLKKRSAAKSVYSALKRRSSTVLPGRKQVPPCAVAGALAPVGMRNSCVFIRRGARLKPRSFKSNSRSKPPLHTGGMPTLVKAHR